MPPLRPALRPLLALGAACAVAVPALAGGAPATAAPSGLPVVSSGARPGPAALYAPAPRAPQLENTGPWRAAPTLVSGSQSYRAGEWLYQDYLNDDHGARGSADPGSIWGPGDHLYSPTAGSFTYPTDPVYAHNAADLVELRVKPVKGATAFRVTLNTLKDARRTAFTIALGSSPAKVAWPYGAGVSSPGQLFLTWRGSTADLVDAAGAVKGRPGVRVDLARRQVEVTVPTRLWNPGTGKVRTTIGVGLWDPAAGRYLAPAAGPATATRPGGGSPLGVAIVNVGPRLAEPQPKVAGLTMADTAAGAAATSAFWRDNQQSVQLAQGDVSPFSVDVDFAKLARRVRDDSGVPQTGSIDRIMASRTVLGQGVDPTRICFDLAAGFAAGPSCEGRFVGQLQSYNLYVPVKKAPPRGYGLTLLLHSLSANYNQYAGSRNQSQLGERGAGSLVLTPGGRGPDGFYAGLAETDVFEAWADVARRYRLDQGWTSVSGYSMGGFGTYRLLARWPDLFARGFSVVGEPGTADDQLASLRGTPVMSWNAAADELVNINTSETAVRDLTAAGVRFEHRLFLTADHLTLAANDEYSPGAAFLGENRVDRDPARVSYVVDTSEDSGKAGMVADHAYWLSGLRVRDAKAVGTVDATSRAKGKGLPPVLPVTQGAGVMTGGQNQAMAYSVRERAWGPAPVAPRADALVVQATNLRSITVDVRRAGLTCRTAVTGKVDGPVQVVLAGCGRTVTLR